MDKDFPTGINTVCQRMCNIACKLEISPGQLCRWGRKIKTDFNERNKALQLQAQGGDEAMIQELVAMIKSRDDQLALLCAEQEKCDRELGYMLHSLAEGQCTMM